MYTVSAFGEGNVVAHPPTWQDSRGFMFGAGIGALVLTCAGAAWSFVALINRPEVRTWQFVLLVAPAVILIAASVRQLAAVARMPTSPSHAEAIESARHGRRIGRWFATIFGVEVAVIAAAATLLARAGRPLLIPVAVVAIVGAHFVPLATIFQVRTYSLVGIALLVAAGMSLFISDEPIRVFILGLAGAFILWAGAFAVLLLHTRVRASVGAV